MFKKDKATRDAFTFSLGGITAITSVVAAPAIAHDQINRIREDRMSRVCADPSRKPRLSFASQRLAVQFNCA